MIKYLLAFLLLGVCSVAKADDSVGAAVWKDIQSSGTVHVLDNTTPGFFYDFADHKMMSGATTEIYTYRHFSLDSGIVRSIENHDHTLPVLATNIHIGSYLATFKPISNAVKNFRLNQGLLQYFVMGAWGGRDFTDHKNRYGFYSGFRAEFK